MKKSIWIQLGVVFAILGTLMGCTGQGSTQDSEARNQITQLSSQFQTLRGQLDDWQAEVAQLKSQIQTSGNSTEATGGASLRLGFVNAEEVFVKYKGTEEAIQRYRAEKEGKEKELLDLQDRYSAGAISQNEYSTKRIELETVLQSLDQQLTNEITQRIVEAVAEIGESQGYDLVTSRKNVVLYYREGGVVTDLTDQVLQKMDEDFDAENGS